MQSPIFEVL